MRDIIINNYNNIKFTYHGLERLLQLDIDIAEFSISLRTKFDILEEYDDDPRGRSALIMLTIKNMILHTVVSPHDGELLIITVYHPDPQQWIDNRYRRK